MNFSHYIITRFSIKFADFNGKEHNNDVLSEDRLEYRFNIFEKHTLKSMLKQKNKNFVWLIFIDKKLKARYIKRLKQLTKDLPCEIIKYKGDLIDQSKFYEFVNNYLNFETDFTITTRLDDDDEIAPCLVDEIQREVGVIAKNRKPMLWLLFDKGMQYVNNQFKQITINNKNGGIAIGLSLITFNRFGLRYNVYCSAHTRIKQFLEKINIKNNCIKRLAKFNYWIYVKHCWNSSYYKPLKIN